MIQYHYYVKKKVIEYSLKASKGLNKKNHPNTHHATEDLQDVSSLNGPNIDGILAASGLSWIREIGTRKNRR